MTHAEIVRFLASVKSRPATPSWSEVQSHIASLKQDAVARKSEREAKELWVLDAVLQAQNLYVEAFSLLGDKQFYEAWCKLEQCENQLRTLERHESERVVMFGLQFMAEHVSQWQSLFPYKMFTSPGFIEHEKECSICGSVLTPRLDCGHKPGEIYMGSMCYRIITKAELLEVSFVENPVQKYSVPFANHPVTGEKGDFYNYGAVEYARSAIQDPWSAWYAEQTTKLWPHSHFNHIGRNAPCPCGSDKKYKKCCLPKGGVLKEHTQLHLSSEPPKGLPSSVLSLRSRLDS